MGVEDEDRVDLRGVLAGRDQRRVVVQPQALAEPVDGDDLLGGGGGGHGGGDVGRSPWQGEAEKEEEEMEAEEEAGTGHGHAPGSGVDL